MPPLGNSSELASLAVRLEAIGYERLAAQINQIKSRLQEAEQSGQGMTDSLRMQSEAVAQYANALVNLHQARAQDVTATENQTKSSLAASLAEARAAKAAVESAREKRRIAVETEKLTEANIRSGQSTEELGKAQVNRAKADAEVAREQTRFLAAEVKVAEVRKQIAEQNLANAKSSDVVRRRRAELEIATSKLQTAQSRLQQSNRREQRALANVAAVQLRAASATRANTREIREQKRAVDASQFSLHGFRRVLDGNVYTASVVGRAFAAISSPVAALTVGFAFLSTAIITSTQQLQVLERQLRPLQARSRLTNETLQNLGNTINVLGLDRGQGGQGGLQGLQQGFDAAAEASQELRTRLGELERFGTGPAQVALDALGVSLENLQRQSQDGRLLTIIEALQGIPTVSLQQHLAEELLGDQGAEGLATILNSSAEEVRLWTEVIATTRANLSAEQISVARTANDAVDEFRLSVTGLQQEIGQLTAPIETAILYDLANFARGLQQATEVLNHMAGSVFTLDNSFSAIAAVLRGISQTFPILSIPLNAAATGFEAAHQLSVERERERRRSRIPDSLAEGSRARIAFEISSAAELANLREEQEAERARARIRGNQRIAEIDRSHRIAQLRAGEDYSRARLRQISSFALAERRALQDAERRREQVRSSFVTRTRNIRDDFARRRRRAEQQLQEDITNIQEDARRDRERLLLRHQQRLEDIGRNARRDVEDAEERLGHSFAQRNLAIAQIELDTQRRREDERIRHERALNNARETEQSQGASIHERYTNTIARLEEDLSIQLRRITEQRDASLKSIDENAKLASERRLENHQLALQQAEVSFGISSARRVETFNHTRARQQEELHRELFRLRIEHYTAIEKLTAQHVARENEILADLISRNPGGEAQVRVGFSGTSPRQVPPGGERLFGPRRIPEYQASDFINTEVSGDRPGLGEALRNLIYGIERTSVGRVPVPSSGVIIQSLTIEGNVFDGNDFDERVYDSIDRGEASGRLPTRP